MATKRPEKHFSKKYTDPKGAEGPSSLQSGGMSKAMSSMRHVYYACKATPFAANASENIKKITGALELYLTKSEPDKRLPEFIRNIIDITLENSDEVDLKGIVYAFESLEEYALKLAWYPWKKQIRKIKVHAAYVKMHIDPYVKGAKQIFRRLGYQKSRVKDELVIERMPERDAILQVAFDCYIAHKEMEIYLMIFENIKNDGFTVIDVHACRTKCHGTDKDAITWIWENCQPTKKKLYSHHSLDSSTTKYNYKQDKPVFYSIAQPTARDIHPKTLDKEKVARLKMYEEEARKAPLVPPRSSSKAEPIKDTSIPYIDSPKPNYDEGTLEEHVSESLRLVEKSNSFASSEIRRPPPGEEWKEVYKTVENLGEKYYDPGGRGDILKGEEMVPRDEEEYYHLKLNDAAIRRNDALTPLVSTPARNTSHGQAPYSATKYGSDPIKSITSGYGSKPERLGLSPLLDTDLYSSKNTSGYNSHTDKTSISIPRVNLRQSDLYSSSNTRQPMVQPSRVAGSLETDSARRYNRNISVDGAESLNILPEHGDDSKPVITRSMQEPKQQFTTFRGNEQPTRQYTATRKPYDLTTRQTDDPDYVQLKHVNPKGKPSFEKNFQATTQRLYQASSNTSLTRQASVDNGVRSTGTARGEEAVREPRTSMAWQCKSCTYMNASLNITCKMCSKSRQKGAENEPMSIGGSQCKKCTMVNDVGAKKCAVCLEPLKNTPTFV